LSSLPILHFSSMVEQRPSICFRLSVRPHTMQMASTRLISASMARLPSASVSFVPEGPGPYHLLRKHWHCRYGVPWKDETCQYAPYRCRQDIPVWGSLQTLRPVRL